MLTKLTELKTSCHEGFAKHKEDALKGGIMCHKYLATMGLKAFLNSLNEQRNNVFPSLLGQTARACKHVTIQITLMQRNEA